MFEGISAMTLVSRDIQRSLEFYRALGLDLVGTYDAGRFVTLRLGTHMLNLSEEPAADSVRFWGRVIVYVADVDALYQRVVEAGLKPSAPPRDARWGERYFHISDPDGHEFSFARPL